MRGCLGGRALLLWGGAWLLPGGGACVVAPREACMVAPGGRACVAKGVCVVKGGMHGMHPPTPEMRPVIARAVRILLECILVKTMKVSSKEVAIYIKQPPLPPAQFSSFSCSFR